MNTIELLRELSKKPAEEIEFALTQLLAEGVFDFVNLATMYVRSLEFKKRDSDTLLYEANSCVLESLHYTKPPRSDCHKRHIQRCLYHLNMYAKNNFYLSNVNEQFKYIPEIGQQESIYEKMRKGGNI